MCLVIKSAPNICFQSVLRSHDSSGWRWIREPRRIQRTYSIRRKAYQITQEKELTRKGLEGSLLQVDADMNNAIEMRSQKTRQGRRKSVLVLPNVGSGCSLPKSQQRGQVGGQGNLLYFGCWQPWGRAKAHLQPH